MKKIITEFIGTFFLVLSVGLASGDLNVLIIGGVLMVMIFAGGHISGAHYNPAVSMAIFVRGGLGWREMVNYWVAQLAGSTAAVLIAGQLYHVAAATPRALSLPHALTAEFLFTFALAFVVTNVA